VLVLESTAGGGLFASVHVVSPVLLRRGKTTLFLLSFQNLMILVSRWEMVERISSSSPGDLIVFLTCSRNARHWMASRYCFSKLSPRR
jgi:hypothetical protein